MARFSEALNVANRTVRRYRPCFPCCSAADARVVAVPAGAAPASEASVARREKVRERFIGTPAKGGDT